MGQIEKKVKSQSAWKALAYNFLGLIIIFAALLLLRVPLLINADHFLTFDEAYQGSQIIDLMKGGPIHFYYEGVRYAGIPLGLAAIPFFWLLGVSALAYKLPGTLAYALYILSSYWIVKKIHPPAALTTVFLMIFSPIIVLSVSSNNWQHNLIFFLGHIIFLIFFKYKESENPEVGTVFFLGAVIGFSIYSYTYSIIYIASIGVVFVLTHQHWGTVRNKISAKVLLDWWKNKKNVKLKIVAIMDAVIIFFIGVILFSYVFGGFEINFLGYTILQTNTLHKPVGQFMIILAIRILISRDGFIQKFKSNEVSIFLSSIIRIPLVIFGLLGFVIGIFPRIASILTGETTTGGQGFEMEFNPAKIFEHLWELITSFLPRFFDVQEPIVALLTSEWSSIVLVRGGIAVVIAFLIVKSIFYFYASRSTQIKNIVQFKTQKFNPDLVYIIFPVLICAAVVIFQSGPVMRHLLPLHGVVSIWVAIHLDKIRLKSKMIFTGLLFVWAGFSLINAYGFYLNSVNGNSYAAEKIIRNSSIYKLPNLYTGLVSFCEEKRISYVYSDMATAAKVNFFSKGNIVAGIYLQDRRVFRKNQVLSLENGFSIIISKLNEHHLGVYKAFLGNSSLKYSQELVDEKFWVLSDFVGDLVDINSLRDLIPQNF